LTDEATTPEAKAMWETEAAEQFAAWNRVRAAVPAR
jgi:hypothetical protein